jgi:3-oxoacyl-[acyl-carrier protein] reductase
MLMSKSILKEKHEEIGIKSQTYESRMLHDKVAVIFGAGGATGSQVAREFSKEGATLFLSGRHLTSVESVAKGINESHGKAVAAEVNALDEKDVTAYLENVVKQTRRKKIDIVFNAMGLQPDEYDNGKAAIELSYEKFMIPLTTYVVSNFITAKAAAHHMLPHDSGVIIFLTGTPSKGVAPNLAAAGTAFGAVEALTRCLATEWSPLGIRVVCIRSGGMYDTNTIQQAFKTLGSSKEAIWNTMKQGYLLKRMPVVDDVAKLATFIVSDRGKIFTGAIINASNGEVLD